MTDTPQVPPLLVAVIITTRIKSYQPYQSDVQLSGAHLAGSNYKVL